MTIFQIRERRQAIETEHAERLAEAERDYSNTLRHLQERRNGNFVRLLDEICAEFESRPTEPAPPEPQPKADAQPTQPKRRPRVEKPEEPAQTPPKPAEVKPEEPPQPEPVAAPAGPVVLCEHHGKPVDESGLCPDCLF